MKLYNFSVFDSKAHAFMTPFYLPKPDMALRTFGNCINDENHQWAQNPADYTLFELGIFDGNTGVSTQHETKISLGNGVEFQTVKPDAFTKTLLTDVIGNNVDYEDQRTVDGKEYVRLNENQNGEQA